MREKILFFLSLLWTVAFSIFATILLSIPLFSLDIGWENLSRLSGFSHSVLMKNYGVLMKYLLNPFQGKLRMPDFPDSASALQHFAEVKFLFLLVIALVIILLPFFCYFIKNKLVILFHRGIIMAMIAPVILTFIAMTVGFDSFFIAFHKLLFRDNTWLFDPITDPIINVLTDNFFMYNFIIFAIIYETILFILLIVRRRHGARKTSI